MSFDEALSDLLKVKPPEKERRIGGMAKSKVTSKKAAKAASNVLNDGRTGKKSKTAAGSALSQRPSSKKR